MNIAKRLKEYTETPIRELRYSSISRSIWIANAAILLVVILSQLDKTIGFVLTLPLLLYLAIICIQKPRQAFFIVIGTKFVFDGLWVVELPGIDGLKVTHLFVIPLIILIFSRVPIFRGASTLILLLVIYLAWLLLAPIAYGFGVSPELVVRHSMPFFAVVLVSKYLRVWRHMDFLIYVIAIGTLIPLAVILIQYLLGQFGLEILHAKAGDVRGVRISGLYYDSGTSGSVALIALLAAAYLILKKKLQYPGAIVIAYSAAFLAVTASLLGETRSIIGIASVIIGLLFLSGLTARFRLRRILVFLLVVTPVVFIFQDNIESVQSKTDLDSRVGNVTVEELLTDTRKRTFLTGRVGLWQDIWRDFKQSSTAQKSFGSGASTNAHSTYFYLLRKIGALGLVFYLVIHAVMVSEILRNRNVPMPTRVIGVIVVFTILGLGVSLNVTVYTTYQIVLYMLATSIMLLRLPKSEVLESDRYGLAGKFPGQIRSAIF